MGGGLNACSDPLFGAQAVSYLRPSTASAAELTGAGPYACRSAEDCEEPPAAARAPSTPSSAASVATPEPPPPEWVRCGFATNRQWPGARAKEGRCVAADACVEWGGEESAGSWRSSAWVFRWGWFDCESRKLALSAAVALLAIYSTI